MPKPKVEVHKDGSFTINLPKPDSTQKPLFEVELAPVISIDQLALVDIERNEVLSGSELISFIKNNQLDGYHFEKDDIGRYKGKELKTGNEFYVTGHGLTCK